MNQVYFYKEEVRKIREVEVLRLNPFMNQVYFYLKFTPFLNPHARRATS